MSKGKNNLLKKPLLLTFICISLTVSFTGLNQFWLGKDEQPEPFSANSCASSLDLAQAIAVDSSGNVYVTGYSYSCDTDYDYVTLKYDENGNQLWVSRYNGPANGTDYSQAVAVDFEGNVIVSGHSNGKGTSLDATTIKYDGQGRQLWIARYDGPAQRDDYAYALAVDAEGNIYISGYSFGKGTEHDYLILKYDPNGKLLWVARHNPPRNGDDICETIAIDAKENVYVTGIDRTRKTSYDFATLKFSSDGQKVWLARFAGPGGNFDAAKSIAVDLDQHVYVAGFSYAGEKEYDYVTIKYDSNGSQRWIAKYDGPAGRIDKALGLAVSDNGYVYVTGQSCGSGTGSDCNTIKYDKDGHQIWVARYNGPGNGADVAHSIALDSDKNVVVAGYSWGEKTGRDYITIKYSPDGRQLWASKYNGSAGGMDEAKALFLDSEGNIYVTGYSYGEKSDFDYVTLKYDSHGRLLWAARYCGGKKEYPE